MKLRVQPNDATGRWEIHDDAGLLCALESASTAARIVHAVNILPDLTAALELAESAVRYHHVREGCPATLHAVRTALRQTRNLKPINPPPAHALTAQPRKEPTS
jgi:hypothetical protein